MKLVAHQYLNPHLSKPLFCPARVVAIDAEEQPQGRPNLLVTLRIGPMDPELPEQIVYSYIDGLPNADGLYQSFEQAFARSGDTSIMEFIGRWTSIKVTPKQYGETLFSTVNYPKLPAMVKKQVLAFEQLEKNGTLYDHFPKPQKTATVVDDLEF